MTSTFSRMRLSLRHDCQHLGRPTSQTWQCSDCSHGKLTLFTCQLKKRATLPFASGRVARAAVKTVLVCEMCEQYSRTVVDQPGQTSTGAL